MKQTHLIIVNYAILQKAWTNSPFAEVIGINSHKPGYLIVEVEAFVG